MSSWTSSRLLQATGMWTVKLYSLLDHHRALLLLLLFIIQPFVQRNTTATRTLNASLIMSSIIVNQFSLLETASSDWPGRKLSTGEQRPNNTKCDVRMLRTLLTLLLLYSTYLTLVWIAQILVGQSSLYLLLYSPLLLPTPFIWRSSEYWKWICLLWQSHALGVKYQLIICVYNLTYTHIVCLVCDRVVVVGVGVVA